MQIRGLLPANWAGHVKRADPVVNSQNVDISRVKIRMFTRRSWLQTKNQRVTCILFPPSIMLTLYVFAVESLDIVKALVPSNTSVSSARLVIMEMMIAQFLRGLIRWQSTLEVLQLV
jgi:hypothetical protein